MDPGLQCSKPLNRISIIQSDLRPFLVYRQGPHKLSTMVVLEHGQKKQWLHYLQETQSQMRYVLTTTYKQCRSYVVLTRGLDETKPTCIRCSKATYNCKGYDQPWLDETPFIALARERAAKRAREHRESQNALLPDGDVQSEGFLSAKSVAESINLSAFREDICRSFLLHRLSAGPDHSKAMSWWLNPSPKAEVQSRTLVSASRAMSAAFFGRVNQQAKIITEGVLMYGEALRNLSKDLSHPIKAYTFETLGATMALTMYEVRNSSLSTTTSMLIFVQLVHMRAGTPGWISHAGGIGKLIEARGPQLHKTYPEKTIYLESRMLLVCLSHESEAKLPAEPNLPCIR